MDDHLHQGDEPRHVDLTQLEGEPGPRTDPLFERQTHEGEFAGRRFRVRFRSDTPARSPAGTATAVIKLVLAAGLAAAGLAAAGCAMRASDKLTLILAILVFVLVGGFGLFLILRIEQSPRVQREISSSKGEDGGGHRAGPRRV